MCTGVKLEPVNRTGLGRTGILYDRKTSIKHIESLMSMECLTFVDQKRDFKCLLMSTASLFDKKKTDFFQIGFQVLLVFVDFFFPLVFFFQHYFRIFISKLQSETFPLFFIYFILIVYSCTRTER